MCARLRRPRTKPTGDVGVGSTRCDEATRERAALETAARLRTDAENF